MRKKLICLVLSLIMILPAALSGCGEKKTDDGTSEEASARPAVSINFMLISEKAVSPEDEALIESAFNDITQSKFTTKVDLIYCTEDEYYAELDKRLAAAEDYKKNSASADILLPGETASETEETTAETIVNELGQRLLKYPDISEGQLDVVFVSGKQNVKKYVDSGALQKLDKSLDSTSKVLKDYIYPSLLQCCKYKDGTYAIPTNREIGEYTYLLVNRELAEKYYFNVAKLSSVSACVDFVNEIVKNEPNVAPVLSYAEPAGMYYWLGEEPSLIASYIPAAATLGSRTTARSIFDIAPYAEHAILMQRCKDNGWFANDPENTADFGIAVLTGDCGILDKYGDKYANTVLQYPVLEEEDAYKYMFGVTAYTADFTRSMEVITLINTDAEVKNLLQYGIEGIHYNFDDDGNMVELNGNYKMNTLYTGNTLIGYPGVGQTKADFDNAKIGNAASKISPFYGFGDEKEQADKAYTQRVKELSDQYMEGMKACTNAEELMEFFDTARTELVSDTTYRGAVASSSETPTLYSLYSAWFEKLWPSEE